MSQDAPLLQVGDVVDLLENAPVRPTLHLRRGTRGRVVDMDAADDPAGVGFVAVVFPGSVIPLRIHRRWLRRV